MRSVLRPALVVFVVLTAITGLAYPLALTAVAALAAPELSTGAPERGASGAIVGSRLVGQPFVDPGYLWGRPSATAGAPYDGAASAASNLGPTNPALVDAVRARVAALRAGSPGAPSEPVPIELVTTSASGLDPHVSPAAARWQVPRIARARGLGEAEVQAIVDAHVIPRLLGVFGEPVVDVLAVNVALDARAGRK
jgi:K+-transporting ATPase ATPase C chain